MHHEDSSQYRMFENSVIAFCAKWCHRGHTDNIHVDGLDELLCFSLFLLPECLCEQLNMMNIV